MPFLKKSTKQQFRHSFANNPLRKWRAFACCSILILSLMHCHRANASEIFVNNVNGSDANSGLSASQAFKTIAQSLRILKPGDILHITNTGVAYKESLPLINIQGSEAAPILIDGHGATLSGCEPIKPDQWQLVGPGLYRDSIFYTANRFVPDFLRIYFFLFKGEMNRMGRSRKGPNMPFKDPAALKEKEWSFVESEKAFYLKIDPAKTLADYNIQRPVRSNGIAVVGATQYVTVRNLIVTNVFNDGIGLTSSPDGQPKKVSFRNIKVMYCGDDGISAHEGTACDMEDLVSIGNATGICDAGISSTSYNRVFIKDCVGMDICFMNEKPEGSGTHSIRNAVVIGNGYRPLVLSTHKPGAKLTVDLVNVLIVPCKVPDTLRHNEVHISGNSFISLKDCTFAGLPLAGNTKPVSIENTIIDGERATRAAGANVQKMVERTNQVNTWFKQAMLNNR